MAAQVVEIADTVRGGKKVRISQKDGTTEDRSDMVDRSRLMIEARKCLASKLAPKPVDTFWVLGFSDNVSIWLAQSIGFEFRFIDFIQGQQQSLQYYERLAELP